MRGIGAVSTAAAASGSNQMLNSAAGVTFPRERRRQVGHRTDRHERDLVRVLFDGLDDEGHRSGLPGASRGDASSVRRQYLGPGIERALERNRAPLRFLSGGARGCVDERRVGAEVERDGVCAGQLEQMQHVLGALGHGVVPGDHGDPQDLDQVTPLQQHRQRRRVVVEDRRVGVEDDTHDRSTLRLQAIGFGRSLTHQDKAGHAR